MKLETIIKGMPTEKLREVMEGAARVRLGEEHYFTLTLTFLKDHVNDPDDPQRQSLMDHLQIELHKLNDDELGTFVEGMIQNISNTENHLKLTQ